MTQPGIEPRSPGPLAKVNFAIHHKVLGELQKNKQELFTHLRTDWESIPPKYFYELQERVPGILLRSNKCP